MPSAPTLLLVGLGPGLSLAVCRRFAQAGHRIAFVVRTEAQVADFEGQFAAHGIEATGVTAPASDPAGLQAGLETLVERWGVPEATLYNVSIFRGEQPPSRIVPEEFVEDLKLNVLGALVTTQTLLAHYRRQGTGTLLYTGGGSALYPQAAYASLSIGKVALRNLVFAVADEVRAEGIRVGMLRIDGAIKPGTAFDPEKIAEAYYQMYAGLTLTGEVETVFGGA